MGGAIFRVKRVFRMYNIDNRVEKVLSKGKPDVAPRFSVPNQSSEKNEVPDAIHRKDEKLLKFLHDVKVNSTGVNPVIRRVDENSKENSTSLNRLSEPLNEESVDGAFGYVEPQRIPIGRVSLRQFLTFLQQNRDSPQDFTVERFSEHYKIKPEMAQRLFKYHSLLSRQEISRPQKKIELQPLEETKPEERKRPEHIESGFTSKF